MKIYYILLLGLTSTNVFAQDLQYSQQEAIQEQVLSRVDLDTRYCMHRTAQAFLVNGMRDQQRIVDNLVKVCGRQMKAAYVNFQISRPDLVEPYLQALAYEELSYAPGVKLSTRNEK